MVKTVQRSTSANTKRDRGQSPREFHYAGVEGVERIPSLNILDKISELGL